MEEKKQTNCLILGPHGGEFTRIRQRMAEALNDIGIDSFTIDELFSLGKETSFYVFMALDKAIFVIVDLTGYDPNVIYELGYIHAKRIKSILFIQKGYDRIPYEVAGNILIDYDPDNGDELEQKIKLWASDYVGDMKQTESL